MKSWEEMSRKEQLQTIFWDAYKDAHGFRPNHLDLESLSETELENEISKLGSMIEEQENERKDDEAFAAVQYERRIQNLIEIGAKDRAMALRWIHDAEGTYGDNEYLCYKLGLPYDFFKNLS